MDSDHLGPATVIGKDGLARSVQPEICPGLRHIFDLVVRGDARPKIIIHRKIKGGIERTHLLPQICTEEHGLLRDVDISLTEQAVICLRRIKFADHLSSFVDEIAIAINHP